MMGQQNVDICYQVASQTGIGVLDAAKELKLYAIGVDGDQEEAFKGSNPDMAKVIVTSMMKRVDQSILRAVRLAEQGTLAWGEKEVVGLKEQGVGIVYTGNFRQDLSAAAQEKIKNLEQEIISGQIKVSSALGMPDADFQKICASVRP
jgi:basic membrane protein A